MKVKDLINLLNEHCPDDRLFIATETGEDYDIAKVELSLFSPYVTLRIGKVND